jgi:hypothetical protein
MKEISNKWTPIADLPENYISLINLRLNILKEKWLKLKPLIKKENFASFIDKIRTEWVIELGNVENIYFISDKIIETLVKDGLYSIQLPHQGNSSLVVDPQAFFISHSEVFDALYEMTGSNNYLSKYTIRGMHALITENQTTAIALDSFGKRINIPLSKGIFKKWPNNPVTIKGSIHQYCPPEQVEPELTRLLNFHAEHILKSVPVEIEAAWLHHRFLQIHPFQDGNGRVARVLASLSYIKAGLFPPIVKLHDKSSYLQGINLADSGNLKPLIDYFSDLVSDKLEIYIEQINKNLQS